MEKLHNQSIKTGKSYAELYKLNWCDTTIKVVLTVIKGNLFLVAYSDEFDTFTQKCLSYNLKE